MARKRIKMKKAREILRLHFECNLSNQQIAEATRTAKGSVYNCIARFKARGLRWPLPEEMCDRELEQKLYPDSGGKRSQAVVPDFERIHREFTRPNVTLELLYEEYRHSTACALSRSSFYRHYAGYRNNLPAEMKVIHKGADKLFVDYSGKKLRYRDRQTHTWVEVEFFVAGWGASSYCYCEASGSQSVQDWVSSHVRALEYFDCVPAAIVPDNLKSGVIKANFYEPGINKLYNLFAKHYDTAILPARARKPRDKAVVESNVLHLQRFIFGRLRDRTFYSLSQLNEAIWQLLEQFNNRPMQQYKESRRQRFEQLDRPYAKKLPSRRFVYSAVKTGVRVAPNYHIEFDKHFYSVPYRLARSSVDVYHSGEVIEIYHEGRHVCRHRKKASNYRYTTCKEHMPDQHRFLKGWSAPWFIAQAQKIGPVTAELVCRILDSKRHPEQGFRAAMGILNLKKQYRPERVENAAARALYFGSLSVKGMKNILAKQLDKEPLHKTQPRRVPVHENIRGRHYYH